MQGCGGPAPRPRATHPQPRAPFPLGIHVVCPGDHGHLSVRGVRGPQDTEGDRDGSSGALPLLGDEPVSPQETVPLSLAPAPPGSSHQSLRAARPLAVSVGTATAGPGRGGGGGAGARRPAELAELAERSASARPQGPQKPGGRAHRPPHPSAEPTILRAGATEETGLRGSDEAGSRCPPSPPPWGSAGGKAGRPGLLAHAAPSSALLPPNPPEGKPRNGPVPGVPASALGGTLPPPPRTFSP